MTLRVGSVRDLFRFISELVDGESTRRNSCRIPDRGVILSDEAPAAAGAKESKDLRLLLAMRNGHWRLGVAFLLAVLACAPPSHAQTTPAPTALDLAARVDRHYDQLHSLVAAFREDYAGLGMTRTESGTLFLRKPGRMLWQYSTPAGKIFLLDGKFAWLYTRGDAQVQRIPAKDIDDLRSPLRFLLGHTELEKELTGLKIAAASNGLYTLTGIPKGQEKRVTRLSLTVTAEGSIAAIEVVEVDGASTRFAFSSEKPDAPIPPDTFHFAPPPGIPVVDAMPPV